MQSRPSKKQCGLMINHILSGNYSIVPSLASDFGYKFLSYFDQSNGQTYYVLRHDGKLSNPNWWGTYFFNPNAMHNLLNFTAPHPTNDHYTPSLAGFLFYEMDANFLGIAGRYRCASSDHSPCSGQTKICTGDVSEPFRKSDGAHYTKGTFQFTGEEVALYNPSSVFPQIHAFYYDPGEPDMVISNGTFNDPFPTTGTDYVKRFRQFFLDNYSDNDLFDDVRAPHLDGYSLLTGTTNVLGRFVNQYTGDICEGTLYMVDMPVNDRFMHAEFRHEYGECSAVNYGIIRDAFEYTYQSIKRLRSAAHVIIKDKEAVEVYPNPAVHSFKVRLTENFEDTDPLQVNIVNQIGEVVYTARFTNAGEYTVDVSHLGTGNYIVQLNANSYHEWKKLMIIR